VLFKGVQIKNMSEASKVKTFVFKEEKLGFNKLYICSPLGGVDVFRGDLPQKA